MPNSLEHRIQLTLDRDEAALVAIGIALGGAFGNGDIGRQLTLTVQLGIAMRRLEPDRFNALLERMATLINTGFSDMHFAADIPDKAKPSRCAEEDHCPCFYDPSDGVCCFCAAHLT